MANKIVLMGVQGSGKGTQSKMLAASLGLPHVSTGDLFRANISQGTELGKKAQRYTDKGQLVPDAIVIDMVADRIRQHDAKGGFILDGFPRSAVQLAAIEYLEPIDTVVLLELDDQTAIARLGGRSECPKCGILYGANRQPKTAGVCDRCGGPLKERADDKDVEAIRSRLDAYHREVQTLVDYYEWKGALKRVNGAGSVDEVAAAVKKAVTS
jgi:adenylate kinase